MFGRIEKEQMMEAELRIIDDMKCLLEHKPEDMLMWRGTMQDLMLMTHILYESEEMWEDGMLVPFKVLVRRACSILHKRVPVNPTSYVNQARDCKGERKRPLLLRYNGKLFT